MHIDARTFIPTGETESVAFGVLHHGTVMLDCRRVTAALTEHYSGERRLIARDAHGRHFATILERGNITSSHRPAGLAAWVAHAIERSQPHHGRDF